MGWKRGILGACCALLGLLLTGCVFSSSPEDMYSLPQLPSEYTELRDQLDSIVSAGAEYAAPTSGANTQSVQLTDLDGDGVEEAVAFFRKADDEKPLKIYIFRAAGESYEQAALIESSGTAIHSIRYVDMNNDGLREIIVGWRVSADIQALGVYSLQNYEPRLLMSSLYTRYEVLDFDDDLIQEIVLLCSDNQGDPVAELYDWEGEDMVAHSTTRLSMTMAELRSMDVGALQDGETALFVTGVAEDTRSITDILAYRQDVISNIVRSDVTGVTSEIFRYISLEPMDINGDGVTEVPMPVVLPSVTENSEEVFWQVYWLCYNARGQRETVVSTYHNINEGWYLLLPDQWEGQIAVRQELDSDERATIFSARTGDGSYEDVMAIYTITGNSREYKATRDGRFVLKREVGTIYSGIFFDYNDSWRHAISQEELNQNFRLIAKEWSAGEN